MMFKVRTPFHFQTAVHWVFSFLFEEILKLDFLIVPSTQPGYCFTLDGKHLDLPDIFFFKASSAWLKPESQPTLPLSYWDVSSSGLHAPTLTEPLPILFGNSGVVLSDNQIHCHVDIIGSIFFMLSRYEEVVLPDRDNHCRFPASASLAQKAGFLDHPVVDEYIELLWACMKYLWPQLERKTRRGQVYVTCDVDEPFDSGALSFRKFGRSFGGDLLKRRNAGLAVKRAYNLFASRRGDYRFEPYYTFDWYMDVCEQHGRRCIFYFIPVNGTCVYDGCYALTEPRILSLIRKISDRGHEVGVHSSYNSFQDAAQLLKERQGMIAACEKAGVQHVNVRGNRQHFLRWDTGRTQDYLDAAGFEYDTTGSFADAPGFRYGTSRTFAMWSWQKNEPLKIKQRPLVLMEASVIDDEHMGMGYTDKALELMMTLKRRALQYGGDFTFLWHNSHLLNRQDREFFLQLIT
jgi:hypothetical protein